MERIGCRHTVGNRRGINHAPQSQKPAEYLSAAVPGGLQQKSAHLDGKAMKYSLAILMAIPGWRQSGFAFENDAELGRR